MITIKQRLIKQISYSTTYAEFCKVQKSEQILQCTGETYKISTQTIKKYLSGEKTQTKGQKIEYKIDPRIQKCLFDS